MQEVSIVARRGCGDGTKKLNMTIKKREAQVIVSRSVSEKEAVIKKARDAVIKAALEIAALAPSYVDPRSPRGIFQNAVAEYVRLGGK